MTEIDAALAELPEGVFDEANIADAPPVVRHYFQRSIAPGTPLVTAVRVRRRRC